MGRHGRARKGPIVRILILGEEGVGKKSLKSKFTTLTYPPTLGNDPTLTDRHVLSLSQHQFDDGPIIRPPGSLQSLLSRPLRESLDITFPSEKPRRPASASSTFSNLGSVLQLNNPEDDDDANLHHLPLEPILLHVPTEPSHHHPHPQRNNPIPSSRPVEIQLEITTHTPPSADDHQALHQALPKEDNHHPYDAILLVYSATCRPSFNAVAAIHAAIPFARLQRAGRRRRNGTSRWGGGRRASSLRRVRSNIFSSHCSAGDGDENGEVVVALVGNKSDVDFGFGDDDGHDDDVNLEFERHLVEKQAVLEEADVEERSLVHPLYRESRRLCEDDFSAPMMSPRSVSVRSTRSVQVCGQARHQLDIDDGGRRSVLSDNGVAGRQQRVLSTFSGAGVLNLVPEGIEPPSRHMVSVEKKTSIEQWMEDRRSGDKDNCLNWVYEGGGRQYPNEIDNDDDVESDTTVAPPPPRPRERRARREVSRLEGELLSRALLLNVPFHETSAVTGESVAEALQAIVGEVLREMGHQPQDLGHWQRGADSCSCEQTRVNEKVSSTNHRELAGKGQEQKRKRRTLFKKRMLRADEKDMKETLGALKREEHQEPVPDIVLQATDDVEDEQHEDRSKDMMIMGVVDGDTMVDMGGAADNSGVKATQTLTPEVPQRKQRRDSALERFKKVFTRRSEAVMVSDVAI